MNLTTSIRPFAILGSAALLAAAGQALAVDPATHARHCEVAAAAHHGVHTLVIPARAEESQSDHEWSDGQNDVKIQRKNGKVRITLNGKEIMNLDDADLFEAEIAGAQEHAERAQGWARQFRERMRGDMPPGPMGTIHLGETPKVMIGVTMETLAEAGAEAPAGIDAENATLITRVVEGLPAEKGGLKEGDIVVQINGSSSAAPDDIRGAIKEKNAGDELKLRVLRDGAEKDIAIALAAYDAEKLGSPMAWGFSAGPGGNTFKRMSDEDLKALKELRAQMAEKSAELEKMASKLDAADSTDREKLAAMMAELGGEMATLGSRMGGIAGYGAQWRFFNDENAPLNLRRLPRMHLEQGQDGPSKAFVFTPEDAGNTDDRMKQLDERLERLEKMLEKVSKELENEKP